ncbi:leucine-rich repeat domain-containing protein [Vibrio penaeicida]|nr:hypothetical protein [Vibrio penaeicida]
MISKLLISIFIFYSFPLIAYEMTERKMILSYSSEAKSFVEIHDGYIGYSYVLEAGKRMNYLPESESIIDNSSVVRMFKRASFNGGKYINFYNYKKYKNHVVINENGHIIQLVLHILSNKQHSHRELMDFISSLKSLEYLSLEFNNSKIKELDLTTLKNLKQVRINKLSDGIISLPIESKLEVLDLYSEKEIKINNIKYQEYIKASSLVGAYMRLSDFEELNNLEVLDLFYSRDNTLDTEVIFNLSNLGKLESLYLPTEKNVKSIGLKGLVNLKKLSFGSDNDYSHTIIPENVEYVIAGGEINNSIPDFSKNNKLKKLILKNTSIKNLKGLSNLPKLEEIIIEHSKLETMDGLKNLPSLKKLTFYGGNLTEIGKMEGVENLEELVITRNKIKEVKNVNHLSSLTFLRLFNNQIDTLDFNEVKDLAYCGIGLLYNPIEKTMTKEDEEKLENLYEYGNINGKQ